MSTETENTFPRELENMNAEARLHAIASILAPLPAVVGGGLAYNIALGCDEATIRELWARVENLDPPLARRIAAALEER